MYTDLRSCGGIEHYTTVCKVAKIINHVLCASKIAIRDNRVIIGNNGPHYRDVSRRQRFRKRKLNT